MYLCYRHRYWLMGKLLSCHHTFLPTKTSPSKFVNLQFYKEADHLGDEKPSFPMEICCYNHQIAAPDKKGFYQKIPKQFQIFRYLIFCVSKSFILLLSIKRGNFHSTGSSFLDVKSEALSNSKQGIL